MNDLRVLSREIMMKYYECALIDKIQALIIPFELS